MRNIWIITKREIGGYFATPLAYIFVAAFAALTGAFTFYVGGFFERGQSDLRPLFEFQPWLLLLLVPAISMRLWAEEKKSGSIELLMTLPVTIGQTVIGKFLAAWAVLAVALLMTMPMWISVNLLGSPDNGVIAASYFGCWLLAGAFLAIGGAISATTSNQVIAFVITLVVCFLFVMSGFETMLQAFEGWLPDYVFTVIASMSFLSHFDQFVKGLIGLTTIVFFVSMIVLWLFVNVVVLDQSKAG
jgi:ABC-2 type transport system permease protein